MCSGASSPVVLNVEITARFESKVIETKTMGSLLMALAMTGQDLAGEVVGGGFVKFGHVPLLV